MDELIIWLRQQHIIDPVLQKVFSDGGAASVAGRGPVVFRAPNSPEKAVYPVGLISGDENEVMATGEGLNKFVSGLLRIEWRTQFIEGQTDYLGILKRLKERSWDLVQGKASRAPGLNPAGYQIPGQAPQVPPADPEVLPGIINVRVGPTMQVVWCRQVEPTRGMPVPDATIAAHQTTYEVTLSRYNR